MIVVVAVAVFGFFQNENKGGSIGGGGTSCQDEFRAGQPGSTTSGVRLLCRNEYISLYDPARKAWIAEAGAYDLLVGGSAADIELQETVRLE